MTKTSHLVLIAMAAVMTATTPAFAVDSENPNWPCVQRKVEKLTSAQIWDGPPVDDIKDWWKDKEVSKLSRYVITRRVAMEDVEKAIEEFANSIPEGPERDKRLTLLFAGVLDQTNTNRTRIVNGIEEFQKRQVGRAEELERESTRLAELHKKVESNPDLADDVKKAQEEYDWNARVFKERQDNIPVACEIPIEIEQRAFAVGRTIRFHMS